MLGVAALVAASILPLLPPASGLTPHAPIFIDGDSEFTPANGIAGGQGTPANPYVIEGWDITSTSGDAVRVQNTNAHFVIRDVRAQSSRNAAVFLYNVENGTIENLTAHDSDMGVFVAESRDITMTRDNFTLDEWGVVVGSSSRVAITDGRFPGIANASIMLSQATEARLSGNVFESRGIWIEGDRLPHYSSHEITRDNLLGGKPVAYYRDSANIDLDGASLGQLIVANCTDVRARNLTIAEAYTGIEMAYVDRASVSSSNLSANVVSVDLFQASNVTATGNSFRQNRQGGVQAAAFRNVTFSANAFSGSPFGIYLYSGDSLTVAGNDFIDNGRGLWIAYASAGRVYHNNFVRSPSGEDYEWTWDIAWDDGYPSGGNYWSDYNGTDRCSGPAQDVCGNPDGFGDTPYGPLYSGVDDRYPLMNPYFSGPDSDPPRTTASLSGREGRAGWYVSNVTVNLTARDNGSGVIVTRYILNGIQWKVYTGPFVIDRDGVHAVEFYSRDMAGNNEPPQSLNVRVDTTAPRTDVVRTGAQGRAGWYVSNVTVGLDADDSASGVASTVYRLDGGPELPTTGYLLLREGVHEIAYRSTDVAGNAEPEGRTTVKVDPTPPAFRVAYAVVSSLGAATRPDVVVTWDAADATSGLDRFEVSVDGSAFESVGTSFSVARTLPDGTHTVRVRAIDVAGNVAEAVISFRVDTNVFSPTGPYAGAPTYAIAAALALAAAVGLLLRRRRGR